MIRSWKILLLLACVVLVVYGNSLPNAFISDDQGITIHAASWSLQTVFSQPHAILRPFMYLMTYKLVGFAPWAFRLPNILLHVINVWLVFFLVELLVNRRVAIIAAILFAVHPLGVESVAWISGGVYPQYTFFLLLSLLLYVLYQKKRQTMIYIASLAAGLFAFESSEKALILPLLIALIEISFGNIRRNWMRLVPFFILALPFGLRYSGFLGKRFEALNTTFYQPTAPIRNPLIDIPFAVTTYLSLLFFPSMLSLYHLDPTPNNNFMIFRAGVAFLSIFLLIFSLYKNRRLFFFLAFFIISLLPTLIPIRLAWTVAERYAYLGSIGIITGAAILYDQLKIKREIKITIIVVIVSLLGLRTIIRNADWHDEISFWSATAKTAPNLPNVHSNLAVALGQKKDYEGAIREFQTTILLKPDWIDPYYNLALSYQRAGKLSDAISWYQKTLTLNPNLWQPYRNLAEIAFAEKRYDEAITYFNAAIEKNPTNANLFVNLALVYQAKSDRKKALAAVTEALNIDPVNEAARSLFQDLTSPSTQR